MRLNKLLAVLTAAVFSQSLMANTTNDRFCGNTLPKEAEDLKGITKTLYGIVSGEAGTRRNWTLMEELMAPKAIISPIFHNSQGLEVKQMSVRSFIELNKQVFADVNFFETEVASKIYRFGNSATIISQYESRDTIGGEPYSTGVNSFQLVNDGNRWCVISVTWDSDKGPYDTDHFSLN